MPNTQYTANTLTASQYTIDASKTLLENRLWLGVPQLTADKLAQFDPAYNGHTFLFVIDVPRFMRWIKDSELHAHAKNLKAIIERASMSFNGQNSINVNFSEQNDGAGRKLQHATQVIKEIDEITIKMHEFKGLVLRNALEKWVTGIFDYKSQRANYHGLIGAHANNGDGAEAAETLEFSPKNHTMQILVVQTDPSWTKIQDAAYYYNMIPTEVPFNTFDWTKGESNIIEDLDIRFKCNEERGPAIMDAAQKYMTNRVLNLVNNSVYDYSKFVPRNFDGAADATTISQLNSDTFVMGANGSPIVNPKK